ncbi:hypothetical protein Syun_007661 [Stephania yunnanensis]|uniref:Uncharacterized protein n=1 Tax=Stephania yunnanensis TaxID=152371 RepID=A0AAP0PZI7_9MAGN
MILRASPSPSLSISIAQFQSPTLLIPNLKTQFRYKYKRLAKSVLLKTKSSVEQDLDGLPPEFYDDEWQALQREKTKELRRRQQEEEEEENRKIDEYREIGSRMKGYPQEEVREARKLVSSFIRAAEEVEERIEKAAEKGELNELVLMEEKDAIRALDLLYRRVEHEGQLKLPSEADDVLLRVDFVIEVDALLQEVRSEQSEEQSTQGLNPESVANRLKQQEKQRTIHQVEALLDLAATLKW